LIGFDPVSFLIKLQSLQPQIQAAIVTAIVSLISSLIVAIFTLKKDERIKRLEKKLEKQQFEDKARLDYKYEAQKDYIRNMSHYSFNYMNYQKVR